MSVVQLGSSGAEASPVATRPPAVPAAAAAVVGWGAALPSTRVTNADLAGRLETSDDWIVARTGIRERRVATQGETTGPLAVQAARAALERAGLAATDIDLVVVATCTSELVMPSTAALVAAELGTPAGGFDVDAACAGFGYALASTAALVATGLSHRALVVGADTMSRVVDPADRSTAVLFGDGAAALVLAAPDRGAAAGRGAPGVPGLLAADLTVDGAGAGLLHIPAGGSRTPASAETVAAGAHYLRMDGRELFRRVVRDVVESVERVLHKAQVDVGDVAWFAPHQANARIVDAVLARTGIAADRTLGNVERFGNTSAASIPLTLVESAEAGLLRDGDLVLVSGFGAGLTVGTLLWRWGSA